MAEARGHALEVVKKQLQAAIAARKCHPCGCLHGTVAALEASEVGRGELASLIADMKVLGAGTVAARPPSRANAG